MGDGMKTLEYVLENYTSQCFDGRDIARLCEFCSLEKVKELGYKPGEDFVQVEWNRENILKQLESDVAFGFEKALSQRGISASFMYEVVKMWNWILEDGLEDFDSYPMYGLPLFKACAEKYGFDNPIGSDTGTEWKYNE